MPEATEYALQNSARDLPSTAAILLVQTILASLVNDVTAWRSARRWYANLSALIQLRWTPAFNNNARTTVSRPQSDHSLFMDWVFAHGPISKTMSTILFSYIKYKRPPARKQRDFTPQQRYFRTSSNLSSIRPNMPPTKSAWLDWHNLKPYSRRGKVEGQAMMASSVFKRKETNTTCMCTATIQAEIIAVRNTQHLLARVHTAERRLADEKAKLDDQRKINSAILQELESSKKKSAHLEQSEGRMRQQVAITERRRKDVQERLDSTIEEMDLLRDRIGELDTKHARIKDELDRVCSERDSLLQRPFYDSECVAQAEVKYAAMERRLKETETGDIRVQQKLQALAGFAFIVLSLLVSAARAFASPLFANDHISRLCEVAARLGIDLNSCANLGRDGWAQGPTNDMAAAINEVDALSRLVSLPQQAPFIRPILDGGAYQAQLASTNGDELSQSQDHTSDGSTQLGYESITQTNHFCETIALDTQPAFIGTSVHEPLNTNVHSTPSSDSIPFGQQTLTSIQPNIQASTTGAGRSNQGDEHTNAGSSTGTVNNASVPSQPQTTTPATRVLPTANASRPRGVPVTAPPVNLNLTTTTTQPKPTEDKPPRKLTSDEEWMLAMGIDDKDIADLAKQQAKIENRSHPEDRPIPAAKPT